MEGDAGNCVDDFFIRYGLTTTKEELPLTDIVKRLPYSDYVFVIDEKGTISEQGHFDTLAATGGYVSSFHLGEPDWNFTPDERSYHVPSVDHKEKIIQTNDDLEAEANRATGDFTIYRYYFDSVGWFGIIVFLVCISGFVFCISFPSKSIHPDEASFY